MIVPILAVIVVILGALSIQEAWSERDIPWQCGKWFLLFFAGLLYFLFF